MIVLVVEDLERQKVATVLQNTEGTYDIDSDDADVTRLIRGTIRQSAKTGIPLRFDKRQRMESGIKYLRLARWLKPKDPDFLEALAEDLAKHELFAYTLETSVTSQV